MKSLQSLLCLIFTVVVCFGQNEMTIASFLADAKNEESVAFQRQKVVQLNTLSYDLPYIEKLEFRTETNEFDFKKQGFLLRISPNSLKNIQTQHQYQESVEYMTEMDLKTATGKAIKKRYDLLVDYIYLKEILAIKRKQELLLGDKVTFLRRSISLSNFDILDLIEAETDVQGNLRDILDLENAITTIEKNIQRNNDLEHEIQVNKSALPSIENIKKVIADSQVDNLGKHPVLAAQSARLYNNMLEYEWESAKSKFSIGYVQAKYGYDPDDSFRKSFSIGIGFEIPLKSASRLDLNELKISVLESESRFNTLKNDLENESFFIQHQVQNLIKKYELVAQQLELGQAEFALEEYRKIAEASPHALIKLRKNTLAIELLLKELQHQIMRSYVDYLNIFGLLSQQPYKNYLSKDLESF